VIRTAPKVGPFAEKALNTERGVNIEGLAVNEGRMYPDSAVLPMRARLS
jgi:hypothetical protein